MTSDNAETPVDLVVIPFGEVREAAQKMPYASDIRLIFTLLFGTGCRICEIDRMKYSMISNGVLYWHLGKNQTGHRKVKLPDWWLTEYEQYRAKHGIPGDRLFSINGHSFRRYFGDARQWLGGNWVKKHQVLHNGQFKDQHIYQLKFSRKNYQTLLFNEKYKSWGDAGVALEFVSKEMHHSSKRMTAYHYIDGSKHLDVTCGDPFKIIQASNQTSMLEWV